MNNDKKILVGKIVAFQGVRGDVRVQTYTATPADFRDLKILSDKFATEDFKFVRALPNTNVIIAHINGFEDRTSAEVLRGTELFINRDALPDAKDGEYYQTDLIGFDVVRDGKKIGTVDCFQNFGAGDIIELDNGEMVAFCGANVDLDKKIIFVK
ncbi:MAG: 16S rRNA processing protein RimM [Alphaproteobacteria bacterium]|nr:16S rRNA processing protein RimM [Alphaproteobacteria bacterium]